MRRSLYITLTSIFAGLAIVFTLLKIEFPFPILPYLMFDLSEVPVVSAYLLVGPSSGFLTSVFHYLFLLNRSGDILGPSMKFAAVFSMLVGLWLYSSLIRLFRGGSNGRLDLLLSSTLGCILRIVVMSIFNVVVLLYIAPAYLSYAAGLLSLLFGYSISESAALSWTLIFTALYNLLHVLFSVLPSIFLVEAIKRRTRGLSGLFGSE